MTKEHGFTGPWITFGGSYSGSLSAWVREKYPHLVKGSVSSSGPLHAKVSFSYSLRSLLAQRCFILLIT